GLAWACARPPPPDDYRAANPAPFGDPALPQAIAFEEYRQRREHGETPDPDDYARRYGVSTEDWPGADAPGSADLEATAHTNRDLAMEAASLAYRQFRQQPAGDGAPEFDPPDPR